MTTSIVTIRLIRNFEYRTMKNLVLRGVDLKMTGRELKELIQQKIQTESGFLPYKKNTFDTLKLHHKAHGAKTDTLIINLGHEELVIEDEDTLEAKGVENETEISFYNLAAYREFEKTYPEHREQKFI
eukprot:comp24530_c0_seq1/m.46767 comp24530_c0_seq1/g.46767  ORF comp24530_c0_seq1/g.46767 comp24530_c0_seq1/m.46767 type:complete len:128 (-) comp24530_c0_seq1:397-780(-)